MYMVYTQQVVYLKSGSYQEGNVVLSKRLVEGCGVVCGILGSQKPPIFCAKTLSDTKFS